MYFVYLMYFVCSWQGGGCANHTRNLANSVGSDVRRAYDRSQHLDQRTTMMQQWAYYLDSLRDGAQVIPIRRAG